MAGTELITVHEDVDPTKAELIRLALENEGIPAFLEGPGGINVLGIKVQVPAIEAKRARKFIEAHEGKSSSQ